MEYNGTNFFYLKKTSMEKYYDKLIKAECLCEYFPDITKIIVRKVMEVFLKDIAEEESIEFNVSAWKLLDNIKASTRISLPNEINNYIEIILANGYAHLYHKNKKISKKPMEVLEMMHNVLCWYIKKENIKTMIPVKDVSFREPSTIEYMEKQALRIQEDILLKNNQINNLRQKIIESNNGYKNISEIRNSIIQIKEEKSHLENLQVLLNRKIQIQKEQVFDMEKKYKIYSMNYENLKKRCTENQELLFEKESQLVKAEIKRQELKATIKELDDKDESIKNIEQYIDEEVKKIRETYENLVCLTNEYQDILETIEFSYDKDLQEILEAKKNNIKVKMNFEDGIFKENIIECTRNIVEAKRKIVIFKEILNEKIRREIKHELFYRSFLGLQGKELRIIYTIINSSNIASNLLSKSRELFLISDEDKFLEAVSKNLQKLKNVNDDEIKLVIYYKLIKLTQIPIGNIYNRRQFINALNGMIDKAYGIIITKKDFKNKITKIDSIISYCLEKVIVSLKNKNSHVQINEDLLSKMCNKTFELKQRPENIEKEKIYFEKFNLDIMSELELKANIKLQPYTFLSIMLELGDFASYKEISEIIFEIYNITMKKNTEHDDKNLAVKFSNEYFMILVFLASEAASFNPKQQEELVPLLIAEIMSANLLDYNDETSLESYKNMVSLWKQKQQKYNDIFIKKEEKESILDVLMKEKVELEINYEELIKNGNTLSQRYSSYKEEFKNIIMNSDKRVLLPSYLNYDELRKKKEKAESNITKSKDKLGNFKSMVSPSMWIDQASKLINQSNMEEAEKLLIEEAKLKPYFKKEYSVFLDLEKQIEETNKLMKKNKEDIKDKQGEIADIKNKIDKLQRSLNLIKEVYLDVEEGDI